MATRLHVSDHGLDGGAALKLTFDEAEDAALLTADEDAARIGRVVAGVALVDIIRGRPGLDRYSGTSTAGPRNRTINSLSGHRVFLGRLRELPSGDKGAADDRPIVCHSTGVEPHFTTGCSRRPGPNGTVANIVPGGTAGSKSPAQATGQPDKPSGPQINTAEIVARANKTVGVDIQKRITGWQQGLSRLESDLQKPRLRYSELNDFRDELQRVRGEIDSFRTHLEPALAAAKDQLACSGPAPAAGQPPEPEDIAQSRAERNYYLGLLSAGQAAINSANLRIDNLIDTIQDIRRKNFTTRLLQPVPGIYSSQTWSRVPDYIPSATHRVRDILTGWWGSLSDQDDVLLFVFEAGLLLLVLSVAAAYGTWRLRRRRSEEGDQPFWRRAAVAGAIVLLWILPVVVPIAFLYGLVAQTHQLPERVDWLLYSTAQSIIIILAVSVLAITVFAPRVPHWRLIPVSDRTARRICGLVLALAIVYGVTTLLYVVTRSCRPPLR